MPAWERGVCSPAAPGRLLFSCRVLLTTAVHQFTCSLPKSIRTEAPGSSWHPSHGQSDEPRRGAASILRPFWVIWVILISYSERRTFFFFFQRTQAFFFSKEQLNAFLL